MAAAGFSALLSESLPSPGLDWSSQAPIGILRARGSQLEAHDIMANIDDGAAISEIGRQYLRVHLTADIGPIRLRHLLKRFGSPEAVLAASMAELQQVEGIGPKLAEAVFRLRDQDAMVEREIQQAASHGLKILCLEDPQYPQGLLNIPDPPICLYIRGRLEPADCVAVAVVGTRRCSHYGREQALRFGEALGSAGFTVVSGLARGVDSWAHRGALQGGGRTIAVLGNGLGTIYPPEHKPLAEQIISSDAGAVISELPSDIPPDAGNFPRRNRIIVGLSLGVIVVEAGKRSGALITARLASEYNREAFAVPGRVDRPEVSAGVNGLIRAGQAKLVTCLHDVLDELDQVGEIMGADLQTPEQPQEDVAAATTGRSTRLTTGERLILDAVVNGAEDADRIHQATKLDIAQITSTLTALQLKGLVRRLPGDRFVARDGSETMNSE